MSTGLNTVESPKRYTSQILIFLLLVASVIAVMLGDFQLREIDNYVKSAGSAGIVVFIALYAIATVAFFPGAVMTLAGGAIFGPVWGSVYNLLGATIGATLAFLCSRYVAAGWVERIAQRNAQFDRLIRGVEKEGWRFVAFVRLVPLFPFNALNYFLGLTKINLTHYIVTTLICMIPGGIAYTYLGYVGRMSVSSDHENLISNIFLAIGLLVLALYLPRFVTKLRAFPFISVLQLRSKLDEKTGDIHLVDVRDEAEYEGDMGHIKGSINLPLNELDKRINELADLKSKSIAIVCRTDRRSIEALKLLKQNQFDQLYIVKGGMTAWLKNGFPSERSNIRERCL